MTFRLRTFRHAPVKQKLLLAITLTTGSALVIAGCGIIAADSFLFQRQLHSNLSALASIVADSSTAALAFNDSQSATEMLAALHAREHVVTACIYRTDGSVLARYVRGPASSMCPPPAATAGIYSTDKGMIVSHPILLQDRRIGTLVILYDLGEIRERARVFGATIIVVLLVSSLLALTLSGQLRTVIAAPILELVHAATSISTMRDYSIRARKLSEDETGILADAFNSMLDGIQFRDNGLSEALVERSLALAEVEHARKFLEITLGSIGDAVIATDIDGNITFANPVAQALVGLASEQMSGRHLDEVFRVIHEHPRTPVENSVSTVLRGGTVADFANHTLLVAQEGAEIPVEASAAPIRDANGLAQGAVLVFRDVTARRRAEETRHRLAAIVESSDDAIIGHDLTGRFTNWNAGAEKMFGYTAEEILGKPTSVIASLELGDEMPEVLSRVARGERVEQYHAMRRTRGGRSINVSIAVSPIHDDLGRIVGASKIARDISAEVEAAERLAAVNRALQRSNESLARSNEDLERFAFIASHDLQEPLRMLTIYSQLLIKNYPGERDEGVNTSIGYITTGARRMQELIADLLAYAEIRTANEEPHAPVDLNVVVAEVIENLKTAVDESGASISAETLPLVAGNRSHFMALFQNLIGNAIKYKGTEAPHVHLSSCEGDGEIRISVADNGIGIQAEYLEKIFVPFKRLHGKQIPGTGIGLAICQRAVERYGGRIWAESEVGKGSTFVIALPGAVRIAKEH